MLNPIYVHLSTVKESPYPVLTGCPCDTVEIAGAMLACLVRKYQRYGKVYSATAISLHISYISVLPKIGLFTQKNQTCHWRILWRTRYISWMLVNTFFFFFWFTYWILALWHAWCWVDIGKLVSSWVTRQPQCGPVSTGLGPGLGYQGA